MSARTYPAWDGTLAHVVAEIIDPVRRTHVRTCVGRYVPESWIPMSGNHPTTCLECFTMNLHVRDAY